MARDFPVRVVYEDDNGIARSKGFHMIDQARRFAAKVGGTRIPARIYIQGELFDTEPTGSAKAYDPRYEIPF